MQWPEYVQREVIKKTSFREQGIISRQVTQIIWPKSSSSQVLVFLSNQVRDYVKSSLNWIKWSPCAVWHAVSSLYKEKRQNANALHLSRLLTTRFILRIGYITQANASKLQKCETTYCMRLKRANISPYKHFQPSLQMTNRVLFDVVVRLLYSALFLHTCETVAWWSHP